MKFRFIFGTAEGSILNETLLLLRLTSFSKSASYSSRARSSI